MSQLPHLRLSTRGTVVVPRVRPAARVHERFLGLMGRPSLESGAGLWLSPCRSIHTWFMRFAIDVIFMDRSGTVLRIARAVRPWRLVWAPRGTHSVLEVAAGWLPHDVLRTGDRVEIG